VEFRGEDGRILAVRGSAEFETAPGQTVSLLPLGRCERVATRGLRWPLRGEPLDLAGRTGVSNVAVGERIGVEVEGGVLLLFLHRRSAGC
jgi:thiamine pyrophosphokinase